MVGKFPDIGRKGAQSENLTRIIEGNSEGKAKVRKGKEVNPVRFCAQSRQTRKLCSSANTDNNCCPRQIQQTTDYSLDRFDTGALETGLVVMSRSKE